MNSKQLQMSAHDYHKIKSGNILFSMGRGGDRELPSPGEVPLIADC